MVSGVLTNLAKIKDFSFEKHHGFGTIILPFRSPIERIANMSKKSTFNT